MSVTRSYICKENPDGVYTGVYCHSNGYLTHNGALLLDHYSTEKRVDKLLSFGNMSYLGERIVSGPDDVHSFGQRQDGVCVFYDRDGGEKEQQAVKIKLEDIDDPSSWIRYCYIYGKDHKWKYFECGHLNEGLKDLRLGLEEEYRKLGFPRPANYYGFYTQDDVKKLRYDYERSIEKEI